MNTPEIPSPQPEPELDLTPVGWIANVQVAGGPEDPPEWDTVCVAGDTQPDDRHGWEPVYSGTQLRQYGASRFYAGGHYARRAVAAAIPAPEGDERAAFEAWAPTAHMRTERWAVNPELYDDEDAISAWSGWNARAALAAQSASAQPVAFDAAGFRAWVPANLPDDTIIGSSAWWADHLAAWAGRFVKTAPGQCAAEGADLEAWRETIHKAALTVGSFGAYFLGSSKRLGADAEMRGHYAKWHQEANDAVNALMDLRDEMGDAA